MDQPDRIPLSGNALFETDLPAVIRNPRIRRTQAESLRLGYDIAECATFNSDPNRETAEIHTNWEAVVEGEEEEGVPREEGRKRKKVSFGSDIDKIWSLKEVEPEDLEPVCERPYRPLAFQLIIAAVFIFALSIAVAVYTLSESKYPKRYGYPLNISVWHNSN